MALKHNKHLAERELWWICCVSTESAADADVVSINEHFALHRKGGKFGCSRRVFHRQGCIYGLHGDQRPLISTSCYVPISLSFALIGRGDKSRNFDRATCAQEMSINSDAFTQRDSPSTCVVNIQLSHMTDAPVNMCCGRLSHFNMHTHILKIDHDHVMSEPQWRTEMFKKHMCTPVSQFSSYFLWI